MPALAHRGMVSSERTTGRERAQRRGRAAGRVRGERVREPRAAFAADASPNWSRAGSVRRGARVDAVAAGRKRGRGSTGAVSVVLVRGGDRAVGGGGGWAVAGAVSGGVELAGAYGVGCGCAEWGGGAAAAAGGDRRGCGGVVVREFSVTAGRGAEEVAGECHGGCDCARLGGDTVEDQDGR
nr:hypothetical protein CFP56_65244 [Quercus suber]